MSSARFTIRDLLWATVVVALALGWWIERRELQTRLKRAETRSAALASSLKMLEGLLDEAYPSWRHRVVPKEFSNAEP